MPKDLIRLNNSQACAACNPLHRRRVLMVSLSFTELIRKHVSFQPPETCSLHAVWAERLAHPSLPPLHFLSSRSHFLLCSLPLLLSLSLLFLFLTFLPVVLIHLKGIMMNLVVLAQILPSRPQERTNYSLPFFILSRLFLFFRWCPRPCCFCEYWKSLGYSWTFDRDSHTSQTQIAEPCVYHTQKANSVIVKCYFICSRHWIFMNSLYIMHHVVVHLSVMVNKARLETIFGD